MEKTEFGQDYIIRQLLIQEITASSHQAHGRLHAFDHATHEVTPLARWAAAKRIRIKK